MKGKEYYNTAVYLRLSRDDGDEGKAESNSITSQRDLLRSFIRKHDDMEIYDFYVDDGWSGANFDRPGYKRMMEDVKAGKVDCVIVKDLSRLGRDYIEAGRLIQKTFPAYGVRFIAVNDNYDSLTADFNEEALVLPVKNFINDSYCRDISSKVKSHQKIKREKGQFIGAFAVYGYVKDPENKNRLVTDKYAAGIVQSIFDWKLEGYSFEAIADRLNGLGILSPMEYKRSNGEKFSTGFHTGIRTKWSAVAVKRILTNEIYTGVLVQGKTERVNYKVKKSVAKPETEWVRIPDAHEAVVAKEEFDIVQDLLQADCRAGAGREKPHMYAGLLYCADCGEPMVRRVSRYKGKTTVRYICSNHNKNGKCTRHSITEEQLDKIVLYGLKSRIDRIVEQSKVVASVRGLEMRYDDIIAFDNEIVGLKAEQEKYRKLRAALYEDFRGDIISEEDFKTFSAIYEKKYTELEKVIRQQTENIKELFKNGLEAGVRLEQFKEVLELDALNRSVLVTFVEKILVYEDKRLQVVLRCQNFYEKTALLYDFIKSTGLDGQEAC
ncbi:MAG: recombinase family protein [Lachnospiraceae bacterium]|nr:recombinase family protein [Lachnospiraceae bacterium]